jgi:hypothetical protein
VLRVEEEEEVKGNFLACDLKRYLSPCQVIQYTFSFGAWLSEIGHIPLVLKDVPGRKASERW